MTLWLNYPRLISVLHSTLISHFSSLTSDISLLTTHYFLLASDEWWVSGFFYTWYYKVLLLIIMIFKSTNKIVSDRCENIIESQIHTLIYSYLITHYSLLITHYSPLTTHYSLFTTHYSLLTIHSWSDSLYQLRYFTYKVTEVKHLKNNNHL